MLTAEARRPDRVSARAIRASRQRLERILSFLDEVTAARLDHAVMDVENDCYYVYVKAGLWFGGLPYFVSLASTRAAAASDANGHSGIALWGTGPDKDCNASVDPSH